MPLEARRAYLENLILATVLPGVAGAVNATGFFAIGSYTSNMTGHAARVGDELAVGHVGGALNALGFLFSFFLGAAAATVLVEAAKKLMQARYLGALLLEALALSAFAVATLALHPMTPPQQLELALVLCFAMGLQNALVTKISGTRIRTTHLTGIVTDLGIESIRGLTWMRDAIVSRKGQVGPRMLWNLIQTDPELKKLRLHLRIASSFVIGATIGPWTYLRLGGVAIFVPVGVILALAFFDGRFGIERHLQQHPSSPSLTPAPRTTTLTGS